MTVCKYNSNLILFFLKLKQHCINLEYYQHLQIILTRSMFRLNKYQIQLEELRFGRSSYSFLVGLNIR